MTTSMHGETLFHFTNEISTLTSILNDGYFKASFSFERLFYQTPMHGSTSIPDLWVPMVSFCDYKLSEIGHHVLNYGSYGVGMSKRWGIEKGLNPVLYVSDQSRVATSFKNILNQVASAKQKINSCNTCQGVLVNADVEMSNIYAWTKNYQGPLVRRGVKASDFRFADDKEWRYVANINYGLAGGVSSLFQTGYSFIPVPSLNCPSCGMPAQLCNVGGRQILKQRQESYLDLIDPNTAKLNFDHDDINFILVATLDDKYKILDFIMKNSCCDDYQKLLLASKITVIEDLDLRDLVPVHHH